MTTLSGSVPVHGSTAGIIVKDTAVTNGKLDEISNNTDIKDNYSSAISKTQPKNLRAQARKEKKDRAGTIEMAQPIAQDAFAKTDLFAATDDTATANSQSSVLELPFAHTITQSISIIPSSIEPETESVLDIRTPNAELHERDLSTAASNLDRHASNKAKRSAHLVRDNNNLRKKVPVKKGRVPLDETAKKNHNNEINLLATVITKRKEKNMTYPPSKISRRTPSMSRRSSGSVTPSSSAGSSALVGEHFEVPVIDPSLDFFRVDHVLYFSTSNMDIFVEEVEEIYCSGPAVWHLNDITTNQSKYCAVVEEPAATNGEGSKEEDTTSSVVLPLPSKNVHETVITDQGIIEQKRQIEVDSWAAVLPEQVMDNSASELNFLFYTNTTGRVSPLSRGEEQALVDMHVTPLNLFAIHAKPSRAEKRAANNFATKTLAEIGGHALPTIEPCPELDVFGSRAQVSTTEQSDLTATCIMTKEGSSDMKQELARPSDKQAFEQDGDIILHQVAEEVTLTADKDTVAAENLDIAVHIAESLASATDISFDVGLTEMANNACLPVIDLCAPTTTSADIYVYDFLAMPNGSGQNAGRRKLNDDLVSLHVLPYLEPPSTARMQNKKSKNEKNVVNIDIASDTSGVEEVMEFVEKPEIEDAIGKLTVDNMTTNKTPTTEEDTTEYAQGDISGSEDMENTTSRRSSPRSRSSTPASSAPSRHSSTPQDGEVHLARNTYLGHTSLEDFIDTLEFEQDGTTAKQDICHTFAALSFEEFEALQGRSPDVINLDLDSVVVQRKVKLGRTSLYAFLRTLAFDGHDVAHVADVIKTFRMAAMSDNSLSAKLKLALTFEE